MYDQYLDIVVKVLTVENFLETKQEDCLQAYGLVMNGNKVEGRRILCEDPKAIQFEGFGEYCNCNKVATVTTHPESRKIFDCLNMDEFQNFLFESIRSQQDEYPNVIHNIKGGEVYCTIKFA